LSFDDDLSNEEGGGPSLEEFYHKLYDPKLTKFHTEIEHPDGMTSIDVVRRHFRKAGLSDAADILDDFCDWKRTNFVAYKRKRAGETVQVAQAQAEAEGAKRDLKQFMTGLQR
jgi:hypothetical protein